MLQELHTRASHNGAFSHHAPPSPAPPAHSFLRKLTAHLEKHFANERFGVSELCRTLCLCPMQVHRKVKKHTGLPPGQYLLLFRLEKALQLLRGTDLNIGEVAWRTGFASQNYFTRAFRKVHGVTPSKARLSEGGEAARL